MKIYYVVNARLPSDKAYGIQIEKMHAAFRAAGVDVALVHPHRLPGGLYAQGRGWFTISATGFMLYSFARLLFRRLRGEQFLIYTIDMDTFSYALLPLIAPTFAETHSPKPPTFPNRFFFARVCGVIATTKATRDTLLRTFALSPERVIVEPNGVDAERFKGTSKEEARTRLALPPDKKIALYIGRFYAWKGLEVLPRAFSGIPDVLGYVVGGDQKEFEAVTESTVPKNMYFAGARPNAEIPLWLSAADALIVLGTARNEDSMKYTSPMKVFEYMAAERPIVASRTNALREVLGPDEAYWYEPDDANSLAHALEAAVSGPAKQGNAERYDWSARARRIVHFMEHA